MLANEPEVGSSTGESVASANRPKSDEVVDPSANISKAKLPPNEPKSVILHTKRVRHLQRKNLEDPHSSDISVIEIEGPAKGVQVYPKLIDDSVTGDDDYACIEDDEQCQFMREVRHWLRVVSELSEFSTGKYRFCACALMVN
jgi:hypothetical protein